MQTTLLLTLLTLAAAQPPRSTPAPTPSPAATPATSAENDGEGSAAVIVLTGGNKTVVRSYRLDGRVVRIVGRDGEPFVLRADLVDLERSAQVTRAYRQHLAEKALKSKAEEEAESARKERAAAARQTHRALSGGRGSVNVAPEIDRREGSAAAAATAAPPDRRGATPPSGLSAKDQARRSALVRRHQELVREYNEMVREAQDPRAAHAQIRVKARALRGELDDIVREVDEIDARRRDR